MILRDFSQHLLIQVIDKCEIKYSDNNKTDRYHRLKDNVIPLFFSISIILSSIVPNCFLFISFLYSKIMISFEAHGGSYYYQKLNLAPSSNRRATSLICIHFLSVGQPPNEHLEDGLNKHLGNAVFFTPVCKTHELFPDAEQPFFQTRIHYSFLLSKYYWFVLGLSYARIATTYFLYVQNRPSFN